MTRLEARLRDELPALADALIAADRRPPADSAPIEHPEHTVTLRDQGPVRRSGRRRWAISVAAALVVAGALAVGLVPRNGPDAAAEFPLWEALPPAPIATRSYAASGWSGTEAVFWAGSSPSRGFAFTDGAAYDPDVGAWRTLTVPGWGHPGLAGTAFDGELYVTAKGGGSRYDPADGSVSDLPRLDGAYLSALVATDDAVWAIGTDGLDATGPGALVAAPYEPATDSWGPVIVHDLTTEDAGVVQQLLRLDAEVLWTGREIVVWGGAAGATVGGLALDPADGTWRTLTAPVPPTGGVGASVATADDGVVVAVVDTGNGTVAVARLSGDTWSWLPVALEVARPATVTAALVGDWLLVLTADEAPATVHVPSGRTMRHTDAPIGGVESPNLVWTGDELVVWGGVADDSEGATGAIWRPHLG